MSGTPTGVVRWTEGDYAVAARVERASASRAGSIDVGGDGALIPRGLSRVLPRFGRGSTDGDVIVVSPVRSKKRTARLRKVLDGLDREHAGAVRRVADRRAPVRARFLTPDDALVDLVMGVAAGGRAKADVAACFRQRSARVPPGRRSASSAAPHRRQLCRMRA
jgi:hypothetical protein